MKIEDHPDFKDKLPRICYVLGGEDNPLKIGEHFKIEGRDILYYIDQCGMINTNSGFVLVEPIIYEIINHPEKILRRQQFSEDEKALMREYCKFGFTFLRKPCGYGTHIERSDGTWFPLPDGMFPQITPQNSPFDCAAYLESEEAK